MTCLTCGIGTLRPLPGNKTHEVCFSTGVFLDYEGLLCICASCVLESAFMLGMLPEAKADELRKNNRELGRQNQKVGVELEQAKQMIRNMAELFKLDIPS